MHRPSLQHFQTAPDTSPSSSTSPPPTEPQVGRLGRQSESLTQGRRASTWVRSTVITHSLVSVLQIRPPSHGRLLSSMIRPRPQRLPWRQFSPQRLPWQQSSDFPGGSSALKDFPGSSSALKDFPGSSSALKDFPGSSSALKDFPGSSSALKDFPGPQRFVWQRLSPQRLSWQQLSPQRPSWYISHCITKEERCRLHAIV